MRVRLKYLWSNRHIMTFMPGIGEFFPETDFFQIIRYLHFFDERNAPNRDTTPNYDIYYIGVLRGGAKGALAPPLKLVKV